jgi:signal recognition particle receptor subunit beta
MSCLRMYASVLHSFMMLRRYHLSLQRLIGASLLVFANKQDIEGSMTDQDIRQVSHV